MKKLILPLLLLIHTYLISQTEIINQTNYGQLKSSGQLNPNKQYSIINNKKSLIESNTPSLSAKTSTSSTSLCGCLLQIDPTFSVVPFSSGFPPYYRCDDGSYGPIFLPFNFTFYGTTYDSVYINNNGTITLKKGLFSFSSGGFPAGSAANLDTIMIAPFWSDVDTQNNASGLVYYKITPNALIVKWDTVGYFSAKVDHKNTFQAILTDGINPLVPNGNIAFCYGDMQWTTGDASSGIGGFGGIPATVGVNKGDKVNYTQIGRFDSTGSFFDGPYNTNDGIDFLSNKSIYINTLNSVNIPPIIINDNLCDTIDVLTGDTLLFVNPIDTAYMPITLLAGENSQTLTVSFSSDAGSNFSFLQQSNLPEYKTYILKFFNGILPVGYYHININASDNGIPSRTTNRSIVIKNTTSPIITGVLNNLFDPMCVSPNPSSGKITIRKEGSKEKKAIFTNVFGEVVCELELTSKETSADISHLSNGIYFLHIGDLKAIKLIKQ